MKSNEYDFSLKPDIERLKKKVLNIEKMLDNRYAILDKYFMNLNERVNSIEFLLAEIENFNEEKK